MIKHSVVIVLLAFLVFPFQALGNSEKPSGMPDSDGKVPIKKICYHEEPKQAFAHRQAYRNNAGELTRMEVTIYVDLCELRDFGAGPQDVKKFIKHEKAHARGWEHGEGTPETNAAYSPSITITGR